MASSCIFCQIINKTAPATISYEDEEIIIFNDTKPAAKSHYLVVPKRHIKNAKELGKEDRLILRTLIDNAEKILENDGYSKNSCLFGFHWPPFNSVSHLHLHAIAPMEDMSFISSLIFKQNSYWFVSPEYVLGRIEDISSSL